MSAGRIRPRLIAVWLTFALVVGAIVAMDRTGLFRQRPNADRHGHPPATQRKLLPVPLEDLGAIEILVSDTSYRFERDEHGAWFHHAHPTGRSDESGHVHETDPSIAARIDKAFAALGRARVKHEFAFSPHMKDYGLAKPRLRIRIYRHHETRPLARFSVGSLAPDTLSRYVLPAGTFSVLTVADYQIENLISLVEAVGEHSEIPGKRGGFD